MPSTEELEEVKVDIHEPEAVKGVGFLIKLCCKSQKFYGRADKNNSRRKGELAAETMQIDPKSA